MALGIAGAGYPVLAQQPQDVGTVYPEAYATQAIIVPSFEAIGVEAYSTPILSRVIANDLRLSGFFHTPPNPEFAEELQQLDLKNGAIDYGEWSRLGVSYVVKGQYKIQGQNLEVEVRVWNVSTGDYIFGKRYPLELYERNRPRDLAHLISNHVVERITGFPGIADTKILYVGETTSTPGRQQKELFVMDQDGENRRQLTRGKNPLFLVAVPAWGANGTEVYFTTFKDYNPDLAGMYLDGTYEWFISRYPGNNMSPSWSPARKEIVLTLGKDGNAEIYTMDRAGKINRRLTRNTGIDSAPCWSPSGDEICFTSDRDGTKQLYLMDSGGGNLRRLTSSGTYNDGASWAPRSDRIAFASRINGVFQICTIRSDGTDLLQLTRSNTNCEAPTWAPNGWVIAYTSESSGQAQIHTVFADGRAISQLTTGKKSYSSAWSPKFG